MTPPNQNPAGALACSYLGSQHNATRSRSRSTFAPGGRAQQRTNRTSPPLLSIDGTDSRTPDRTLSARTDRLLVPSVNLPIAVGGRAFPVAGPTVWNSPPDSVISAPSLSTFSRRLKHFCSRPRSLTLSQIPGQLFPTSSGS